MFQVTDPRARRPGSRDRGRDALDRGFEDGKHAQAFPTFGFERTGRPVTSFCRIADRPIRVREPVPEPDALIIQDPTLLHQVKVFSGLRTTATS